MGATGVRIHGAPGAEQTPPNIGPTLASKNPRFMYGVLGAALISVHAT